MLKSYFSMTLLMLSVATSAFGQVKLERKLVENASYTHEASVKIEQRLTIGGMDIDTSVDTRTTTKRTFGKRDESGNLRREEKVTGLQITMNTPMGPYIFDSANPDNKGTSPLEMLRDVHKQLSQRTSNIVYGKDNRVQSVEFDQNLLASLPAEVQGLVKSQVDTEYLKSVANQEIDRIPTDPVSQGDTWTRTENVNFGAGQVMTFQTEYKYEGTVEKDGKTYDKITSKILSVMFSIQDSPLPLTVKSSELKAGDSTSTILFDREAGRVAEEESKLHVTGDLTFEVNNSELPSKLDLKITSTQTSKAS